MPKYRTDTIRHEMQSAYEHGGVTDCCTLANGKFSTQVEYDYCEHCSCETPFLEGECLCCGQ